MVDSIYRTRSLGVGAQGLPDQYADGKAAKVWEYYIGSKQARTSQYKQWLSQQLRDRGCQRVLDAACGTGVDSAMLVEDGFQVLSTDASDKMLKYALKERWNRRKEPHFDSWVIEEANWLTLVDDLEELKPEDGFDAVVCLGNSFAHLPDFEGRQSNQKCALQNFYEMLKEDGVLLIDHRNYDHILATGKAPTNNVYYNSSHILDIKCSNLYVNARPSLVTLDYTMDMGTLLKTDIGTRPSKRFATEFEKSTHNFRLSYYPHCLRDFSQLLTDTFGPDSKHQVYGDFRPLGEVQNPAYYIHAIQRPQQN